MKKVSMMLVAALLFSGSLFAQQKKWSELTDEQKMMQLKSFVKDNQKFMKDSLMLTSDQIDDVNNVNLCYLATLDRIDRYGKTDEGKEEYANYVTAARSMELEAIMGKENRERFYNYVAAKLKKAGVAK